MEVRLAFPIQQAVGGGSWKFSLYHLRQGSRLNVQAERVYELEVRTGDSRTTAPVPSRLPARLVDKRSWFTAILRTFSGRSVRR